jgi:hypothetical protein
MLDKAMHVFVRTAEEDACLWNSRTLAIGQLSGQVAFACDAHHLHKVAPRVCHVVAISEGLPLSGRCIFQKHLHHQHQRHVLASKAHKTTNMLASPPPPNCLSGRGIAQAPGERKEREIDLFLACISVVKFWGAVVCSCGFPGTICRHKLVLVLACPVEGSFYCVTELFQASVTPDLQLSPYAGDTFRQINGDLQFVEL